jgi:hypothetical protein
MTTLSQKKMILEYLQSGRSLTGLDAIRLFGAYRLSGRILDLRREGHPVQTRTIITLTGKRIAEYYIKAV